METAEPGGRDEPDLYTRCLVSWVDFLVRHSGCGLCLLAALTAVSLVYSFQTVRMNSDDSNLIRQDEPFRLDYQEYVRAFPQFDETSLIVITTDSIDLAQDAVDRLSTALEQRPDLVSTLWAPGADPFFEDHGLLYLDDADLDDVVERLAEAQPVLTALAEDPSLRGLFHELELGLDELEEEGEIPSGFTRMAERLSEVGEALLAGRPYRISWADEFLGADEPVYRLIIVQGRKDFDDAISSRSLIEGIRGLARELGLTPENGVRVRLTGMVPLFYEELATLQKGLALAGGLSFVLLGLILGFGVRSLRIIVATLATLLASLSWTTAYAMLTVGEFNIISAAFAVLLIGLGVDFAIHLGLRYEEETRRGLPVSQAMHRAFEGVGGAVSLCALTSAIGFLAFIPTPYRGLGALGIIAGGGMFISLAASFSVFPAVLVLMRAPSRQHVDAQPILARLHPLIARRAGWVVALTVVLAAVAAGLSTRMTFDFSTLGMKDPESESMTTLRELQEQGIVTDYSATVLAPDLASGEALALRLAELDLVAEVRPPSYYLPENQQDKLEVLADAAFFLEPLLYPETALPPPSAQQRLAAVQSLRARIAGLRPSVDSRDPARVAARRLGAILDRLVTGPDPQLGAAELERRVISDLGERIEWLRRAVTVQGVVFEDLPETLRERLVAADGRSRVVALPREDVRDVAALGRFVRAVAQVAPRATGRPAVEAGIGGIVVHTFRLAIGIALVAIAAVLLVTLRSPLDTVMVLLPITLAALFTVAVGVLIQIPFNMSNVVVIPLVLGLGVDNGIHVFMRFRHDRSLAEMMRSSTPRAVLLSALTTLAAFGSLSISHHRGIRSMGILLSISVVCLIVCTLLVLPSMILLRQRWIERCDARAG